MTDLQTVDEATFDEVVLHADKPVLVDFWAEWCPPCHQIAPVLAQIAAERNDQLSVVKLNSDENPAVPARYRVMALPTLILFHRGEMIWSVVGARPKAKLLKELDDALLAAVCPHPTSRWCVQSAVCWWNATRHSPLVFVQTVLAYDGTSNSLPSTKTVTSTR